MRFGICTICIGIVFERLNHNEQKYKGLDFPNANQWHNYMKCCTEAAPEAAAVGPDGQPIAVGEDGQPIPAAPAAPEPEPIPEVIKCHRMPILIFYVQFNDHFNFVIRIKANHTVIPWC